MPAQSKGAPPSGELRGDMAGAGQATGTGACDAGIVCRSLNKKYGSIFALRDVSLSAPRGCFASIIGRSGAGKSTLLEAIAGLLDPDGGDIELAGRTVFSAACRIPPHKRNVGMVFEDLGLWNHLTVRKHVELPTRKRGGADGASAADEIIAGLDLKEVAGRRPGELSAGQRRRCAIARALACRPEILLLDEPLGEFDPPGRRAVGRLIRQWHERLALTTLMVTHHVEDALGLSDYIAVMDSGAILQSGAPEEVHSRPSCEAVASLLDADFPQGGTRRD
ncbi:MAG TPA: ABC transporter ATP-binding protein [Candidatus Brocadiia bacterium]|nr:ABC transporter ATP-binding protein [Candidatus Brocadiia bacterium]